MDENPVHPHEPYLVGSTGDLYQEHIGSSPERVPSNAPTNWSREQTPKYFKNAQWYAIPSHLTIPPLTPPRSPDGTTILASTATSALHTFILPPTLLSPPHPHPLTPYTTHTFPEPIYATTFHPTYTLSSPPTCLILASPRSLPIRLFSPFAPGILSSYPLISPTTEAYITPHSLLFTPNNPSHFLAGSDSSISLFDINRNGSGPITRIFTKRHHSAPSPGIKGLISALATSNSNVLAAGTFSRHIGLYDTQSHNSLIITFPLPTTPTSGAGQGITQLHWTPDSHYLLITERVSDGISVLDIRSPGKQLAWLTGRKAMTQQRLGVDVIGQEVWAGGTDGVVRAWEGVGMREGVVESTWGFRAHDDVVSSAGLHSTGSVLATCSGQRHWGLDTEDVEGANQPVETSDNSLKLWAL